ncbi:MAG TPA: NAD(P)H-hydrate dehydratase [Clostridiales bacterium]|nr:NAD(P)H-hydrate dehydratase [Clostridiales bacterium]
MKPIVTPHTMAHLDRMAINSGIPSKELMFRAAKAINKHLEKFEDILIVTGPGNNGGDGLAVAYILHKQEKNVSVFLAAEPKSEDAIFYFQKLKEAGFNNFVKKIGDSYDAIVDCIFGNGLYKVLSSDYQKIINNLNLCKGYKIAVDIPTGIHGENGQVMGNAFIADTTIVIAAYKFGHFLQDAKDYVGNLIVEDIGIEITESDAFLIEKEDVKKIFPPRKQNAHKYNFGKACIIGGSAKYKGAPILSMLSNTALRAGAGLGYIAYPKSMQKTVLTHAIDEIHIPIDDIDGNIIFDKKALDEIIKTADVIAFGMGIGKGIEVEKTLQYILENFKKTVIIDADGITAFANICKYTATVSKVILTPHVGEALVLIDEEKETILNNLVPIISVYAEVFKVVVLLKGPTNVVTDGDKIFFISNGSVAQAKAGMGDILSGVMAGVEAYNHDPVSSAYAAAFITNLAATNKAKEFGQYGVLASDIPKAIKDLQDEI